MKDRPKITFDIEVRGEPIAVEYTPDYFITSDHFAYLSPHTPLRPHSLSETGYRSHFVGREAVVEAGGPQAYAAKYAAELLAERAGNKPGRGGHAARVKGERSGPTQRELF
jgi:hypothetical protein